MIASCSPKAIKLSSAQNGVIDLSLWNLSGVVKIDGTWDFAWKKFVNPHNFESFKFQHKAEVPSSWNNFKIGEEVVGKLGYATYHVTILLPQKGLYGFYFDNISASYKVWIDDQFFEIGKVGKSRKESLQSSNNHYQYYEAKEKTIELLIQVSNYQRGKGGIGNSLLIGTQEEIKKYRFFKLFSHYTLFGALTISFALFLAVYYFNRDKFALYMCLFSLCFMFHDITLLNRSFPTFFPFINSEIGNKITLSSYLYALLLYVLFLKDLLPIAIYDWYVKFLKYFTFAYSLFSLVVDATIYHQFLNVFYGVMLLSFVYIFGAILYALKQKHESSAFVIVPYLFFIFGAIHDMLYAREIINTYRILPYCVFIFIFGHLFFLAYKFSESYKEGKKNLIILEQKNKEKENAIRDLKEEKKQRQLEKEAKEKAQEEHLREEREKMQALLKAGESEKKISEEQAKRIEELKKFHEEKDSANEKSISFAEQLISVKNKSEANLKTLVSSLKEKEEELKRKMDKLKSAETLLSSIIDENKLLYVESNKLRKLCFFFENGEMLEISVTLKSLRDYNNEWLVQVNQSTLVNSYKAFTMEEKNGKKYLKFNSTEISLSSTYLQKVDEKIFGNEDS